MLYGIRIFACFIIQTIQTVNLIFVSAVMMSMFDRKTWILTVGNVWRERRQFPKIYSFIVIILFSTGSTLEFQIIYTKYIWLVSLIIKLLYYNGISSSIPGTN